MRLRDAARRTNETVKNDRVANQAKMAVSGVTVILKAASCTARTRHRGSETLCGCRLPTSFCQTSTSMMEPHLAILMVHLAIKSEDDLLRVAIPN